MKWIARVLLVLALAVVVVILTFLLPPHLQVRQVNAALPTEAALMQLAQAVDGPVRVSYLLTSSQPTIEGKLGHTSILIEWADGRMFMIDAGMDKQQSTAFGELIQTMGSAEVGASFYGSITELLADRIADIDGVGFTHLHIDHTQGLINFCAARDARIAGFQTSWQASAHNFNTTEGAQIVAEQCLDVQTLSGDELSQVPGFPGLAAYALGGHTPGSTLWAVALDDKILLFSGDITNSKHKLDHDQGKGFLYSYVFVPEDTTRTAALRDWLRALDAKRQFSVLVSHDIEQISAALPVF